MLHTRKKSFRLTTENSFNEKKNAVWYSLFILTKQQPKQSFFNVIYLVACTMYIVLQYLWMIALLIQYSLSRKTVHICNIAFQSVLFCELKKNHTQSRRVLGEWWFLFSVVFKMSSTFGFIELVFVIYTPGTVFAQHSIKSSLHIQFVWKWCFSLFAFKHSKRHPVQKTKRRIHSINSTCKW